MLRRNSIDNVSQIPALGGEADATENRAELSLTASRTTSDNGHLSDLRRLPLSLTLPPTISVWNGSPNVRPVSMWHRVKSWTPGLKHFSRKTSQDAKSVDKDDGRPRKSGGSPERFPSNITFRQQSWDDNTLVTNRKTSTHDGDDPSSRTSHQRYPNRKESIISSEEQSRAKSQSIGRMARGGNQRKWQRLQALQSQVLQIRAAVHEKRGELQQARLRISDADGKFMKIVRDKRNHNSCARECDILNGNFKLLQDARDDYGPLEDAYNALEERLDQHEWDMMKLEGRLFKGDNDIEEFDLDDSYSQTESSNGLDQTVDDKSDPTKSLSKAYLSRLGDLDMARERQSELLIENAQLQERQEIRERMLQPFSRSDTEELANNVTEELQLIQEIDDIKADVQRLYMECLDAGVLPTPSAEAIPSQATSVRKISLESNRSRNHNRSFKGDVSSFPDLNPDLDPDLLVGSDSNFNEDLLTPTTNSFLAVNDVLGHPNGPDTPKPEPSFALPELLQSSSPAAATDFPKQEQQRISPDSLKQITLAPLILSPINIPLPPSPLSSPTAALSNVLSLLESTSLDDPDTVVLPPPNSLPSERQKASREPFPASDGEKTEATHPTPQEQMKPQPLQYPLLHPSPPNPDTESYSHSLLHDLEPGDKADRITRWLLHKLQASIYEIELLERIFEDVQLDAYGDRTTSESERWRMRGRRVKDTRKWQEDVLWFWWRDGAGDYSDREDLVRPRSRETTRSVEIHSVDFKQQVEVLRDGEIARVMESGKGGAHKSRRRDFPAPQIMQVIIKSVEPWKQIHYRLLLRVGMERWSVARSVA